MIATLLLTFLLQLSNVSTVAFSRPAGTYPTPFIMRLTLTVPESHVRIIYTIDGSTPVAAADCKASHGSVVPFGFNLVVKHSMTVTALACRPNGTITTGLITSVTYVVTVPASNDKRLP